MKEGFCSVCSFYLAMQTATFLKNVYYTCNIHNFTSVSDPHNRQRSWDTPWRSFLWYVCIILGRTALHKLNCCVHWSVVKHHAVLWTLCDKYPYVLKNGASTFKFLESSLMASTSLRSGMVRSWGDSRVGYQPSWSRIPVWSQCHTGGEWTRPVNIVDYFYLCSHLVPLTKPACALLIKLLTNFLWSN